MNNNNNKNKNKNNKSNISSITDPILTKLLMECFLHKTTTKATTSSSSTTTSKTTTFLGCDSIKINLVVLVVVLSQKSSIKSLVKIGSVIDEMLLLLLSQPQLIRNSTQLNITKVGFDMKMTLHHHPPPPPPTGNSTSSISQLLLTQF